MSEQAIPSFQLNTERVESASVNEDAANIILQLETWSQARIDRLREIGKSDVEELHVGDVKISDPEFISGFKAGLLISINVMGDFPVSISE